jgi:hypothetical protein
LKGFFRLVSPGAGTSRVKIPGQPGLPAFHGGFGVRKDAVYAGAYLMIDLWPDNLGEESGKAPAAILREQARHLENKTNKMVTGRIEPSYLPKVTVKEKFGSDEDLFMYEFYLEAPVLDYYRCHLLTIFHGINLYPVIIQADEALMTESFGDASRLTADNEEEFLNVLKTIFRANKTETINNSILVQVKEILPNSSF